MGSSASGGRELLQNFDPTIACLQDLQPSAGSLYPAALSWAGGAFSTVPWHVPAPPGYWATSLQPMVWSQAVPVQVRELQLQSACRVGGWVFQQGFVSIPTLQLAVFVVVTF